MTQSAPDKEQPIPVVDPRIDTIEVSRLVETDSLFPLEALLDLIRKLQ